MGQSRYLKHPISKRKIDQNLWSLVPSFIAFWSLILAFVNLRFCFASSGLESQQKPQNSRHSGRSGLYSPRTEGWKAWLSSMKDIFIFSCFVRSKDTFFCFLEEAIRIYTTYMYTINIFLKSHWLGYFLESNPPQQTGMSQSKAFGGAGHFFHLFHLGVGKKRFQEWRRSISEGIASTAS